MVNNFMDTRDIAFKALYRILEEGKPSHVVLSEILSSEDFEKRDKAFITRITEGTIEQKMLIDFCINEMSKVKTDKQKPIIRNALRIGVYQLLFMDSVPDSAAVNETVKLVRKKGLQGLSGFVNGVLRNIAREKEKLIEKSEKNISIKYSCPQWICDYMIKTYGTETGENILRGLQRNPDVTIRTNLSKISADDLMLKLKEFCPDIKKGVHHDYALILPGIDNIKEIPAFKEGLFQVQDESSMFVCEKAGIKPDDLVVDVCAAPGGKTLHAADIITAAKGTGKIISRDVSEAKLKLIKENIERSGFSCIETRVKDATEPEDSLIGKADVVLCDAPCSGLGIIAKKPDIKYNMTPENQKELVNLQRKILKNASELVKPMGTLMFSTCTINREENEENVDWICKELGFKCIEMRQLLPGVDGCDGFFYSKLVKNV